MSSWFCKELFEIEKCGFSKAKRESNFTLSYVYVRRMHNSINIRKMYSSKITFHEMKHDLLLRSYKMYHLVSGLKPKKINLEVLLSNFAVWEVTVVTYAILPLSYKKESN